MRNTEQFQREVLLRTDRKLESKYVMGVNHEYSYDTDDDFASALRLLNGDSDLDFGDYKHAIVMPLADRSLDAIFRSERPDKAQI